MTTLLATEAALRSAAPALRPAAVSARRAASGSIAMYSVEEPIQVGQRIPDIEVETMDDFDAPRAGGTLGTTKSIFSVLGPGKSILLGMPGAYTPTCNDVHLPGFYSLAPELKEKGVSTIALVTVNDRFVNAMWQKSMEECMNVPAGQAPVVMLSDARGDLAESLGLIGYLGRALGVRAKRFALVLDDGVVTYKAVDEGSDVLTDTSAEAVLAHLNESEGLFDDVLPDPVLIGGAGALLFLLWIVSNIFF